jgi:hypothetical protein
MRPETHIRANASKLGKDVRCQFGRKKRGIGRHSPKENEKGKNDIVFPPMKVPVYGGRGCGWTRQCDGAGGLYGQQDGIKNN